MDRLEEIAYNYLDTIYSKNKVTGKRSLGRPHDSQVIYMFVEGNDLKNPAFEWDWYDARISMRPTDYTTLKNMFNLEKPQILKVMKSFVFDKTKDDKVFNEWTPITLDFFTN